jgi:hypothetical protein
MILLYLVRHGIAMDREDPNCPPDTERPLTGRRADRSVASSRADRGNLLRSHRFFVQKDHPLGRLKRDQFSRRVASRIVKNESQGSHLLRSRATPAHGDWTNPAHQRPDHRAQKSGCRVPGTRTNFTTARPVDRPLSSQHASPAGQIAPGSRHQQESYLYFPLMSPINFLRLI